MFTATKYLIIMLAVWWLEVPVATVRAEDTARSTMQIIRGGRQVAQPDLSIITVSNNRQADLLETVHSVERQVFSNFEWIIVDTNSQDGSLEFLRSRANNFTVLFTGSVENIYAAMNLGLSIAKGKYVLFLNAGDSLANVYNLAYIFHAPERFTAEILYGNINLLNKNGKAVNSVVPLSLDDLSTHIEMPIYFQATLLKRELFSKYGNWPTVYPHTGDYELLTRFIHKYHATVQRLPLYLTTVKRYSNVDRQPLKLSLEYTEERHAIRALYYDNAELSKHQIRRAVFVSLAILYIVLFGGIIIWCYQKYLCKHTKVCMILIILVGLAYPSHQAQAKDPLRISGGKQVEHPKLSIITICLNEAENILDTIYSIEQQTFTDYEWIIVDGGSTDGTLEILKQHLPNITLLISEPDKGIYNAMNKGIVASKGEYLNFMNGGDRLSYNYALADVFQDNRYTAEIIYADANVINADGRLGAGREAMATATNIIIRGLPHQSAFIKRALFRSYGLYDSNFRILGDFAWFNQVFHHYHPSMEKAPFYVADFRNYGGISRNSRYKPLQKLETHIILNRVYSYPSLLCLSILCLLMRYPISSILFIGLIFGYFYIRKHRQCH